MTKFPPTPEQAAIIAAAKDTTNNLIVQALAGAAKTSTLVLLGEALPKIPILCLAFNKRIAVEMTERLPPNCVAKTLNGLGHGVWSDFVGKRVNLATDKNFKLLKEAIDPLGKNDKDYAMDNFADILKAIASGKSCGYVPTGHFPRAKGLMDDNEFFNWLDDEPTSLVESLIRSVTLRSIELGLQGTIDFDDQILLPTIFPAHFPSYPLVMVDEAQDLSALNHATLRKLAKKRLIAVGDECQSIYGFRGAHEDSMTLLRETFSMTPLMLSVSFRCPQVVVEHARWRAPHMKFPEWAKRGEVKTLDEWNKSTVPDGAAIICRNNAPLFTIAIKLLRHGRYPQIVGNDIGAYLIKVMKKFGLPSMSKDKALAALDDWVKQKLLKSRNEGKVRDQAACLEVFINETETLGSAIAYAEHIFASQGPIMLMTGHKAKGLEFDHVYCLDKALINLKEPQDRNLLYVIQTRAKQTLTYIETAGFEDEFAKKEDQQNAVQ